MSNVRETVRYLELMGMEKEDVVFLLLAAEERLKVYSDTDRVKLVEQLRARNHTYDEITQLLKAQDAGVPIETVEVPCWSCGGSGIGSPMNDYEALICPTCNGTSMAWQFKVEKHVEE